MKFSTPARTRAELKSKAEIRTSMKQRVRSTTILCVRRNGKVIMAGDGQVTLGQEVLKVKDLALKRSNGIYAVDHVSFSVRAGEVVCQIASVFGECDETITAPQDGYLVRTTTMATVSQGERVATLGIT